MTRIKYPVIFSYGKKFILASVPDFPLDTQGRDKEEAEFMAKDAIKGMTLCYKKDLGKRPPAPSRLKDHKLKRGEWAKLIEVDI